MSRLQPHPRRHGLLELGVIEAAEDASTRPPASDPAVTSAPARSRSARFAHGLESCRRADRLPRAPAPGRAGTRRGGVLHGRQRRALPGGRRGARDPRARAWPSTSTASLPRWRSGSTRSGASGPRTTSTSTAGSCARRPTCGSGSRPTSCPGARTGSRTCSSRASGTTWSARCTSCATVAGHRGLLVWGRGESPERVWRRYFETVAESARSGLYDIVAHPDLVKVWGDRGRGRTRTCALLRARRRGVRGGRRRGRGSTAGLRKPVGELYPRARTWR